MLKKRVYLPKGEWIFAADRSEYNGGAWYEVDVPIDKFAAFVKKSADVIDAF